MNKFKIKTVIVPYDKKENTLLHYQRMGFKLLTACQNTRRYQNGDIHSKNAELTFRFDTEQKNAKELWTVYKQYRKKSDELDLLYEDQYKKGKNPRLKKMFSMSALFTIILTLCCPLIFEDFLDHYDTLDFLAFIIPALCVNCIIGMFLSFLIEFIYVSCIQKKRFINAIEKIPALEKEIVNLTLCGYRLQQ